MEWSARLLVLTGILLAGCGTARNVAVTSFRVIDAPAHFVRRQIDRGETTTTTTVQTSDVAVPGRPVTGPPPSSTAGHGHNYTPNRQTASSSPAPQISKPTPPKRVAPSATPRLTAKPAAQFPTAQPVPGKPGYVYSIDSKGGIVDVTGYKPGDRAKDPYTQQIFIVP